jgi:hypothetical protein
MLSTRRALGLVCLSLVVRAAELAAAAPVFPPLAPLPGTGSLAGLC